MDELLLKAVMGHPISDKDVDDALFELCGEKSNDCYGNSCPVWNAVYYEMVRVADDENDAMNLTVDYIGRHGCHKNPDVMRRVLTTSSWAQANQKGR